MILEVPNAHAETQQEIIANYRAFDPAKDTKGNCEEVTGQFFFKVKEKREKTETVQVDYVFWDTCWIYNPQTCQNEKVRVPRKETKDETKNVTYFEDVVYCVKLSLPADTVKAGAKCDCEDPPPRGGTVHDRFATAEPLRNAAAGRGLVRVVDERRPTKAGGS